MPSQLKRRLDGGRSLEAQRQVAEPQRLSAIAPWGGFCPDLPVYLCTLGDCENVYGLIPIRGRLLPPIGISRLGSSTLPLGDSTPPAAVGQPVTGLFGIRDAVTDAYRRYAVTSDATLGHFNELITGNWTDIPYTGVGAGITGDSTLPFTTTFDFSSFTPDNLVVFTNNLDPVYKHTAGGANYTDFTTAGGLAPFKAVSTAVAFDRVFFLNTSENGTRHSDRLRYTTRGASANLTGLGSGFFDSPEANSAGVAVEKLGATLVAYFRRAVAFFWETGDVSAPLRREYVTTERGLLGKHSFCDLGGGEHFGIYNDGWFILREDKSFVELGQRVVDGAKFPKWHEHFYGRINTEYLDIIDCEYDSQRRGVWILWTDADSIGPNQLWFYDIRTDTAWPQIYPGYPGVLGTYASLSDSLSYDEATAPYPDYNVSYQQLEVREGMPLIVYGGPNGLVFIQNLSTYTVDLNVTSYLYQTHMMPVGRPDLLKVPDTFYLAHLQQGSPGPQILVELFGDIQSKMGLIDQQSLSPGNTATGYTNSDVCGSTVGATVSGSHPVGLVGMELELLYPTGKVHRQ